MILVLNGSPNIDSKTMKATTLLLENTTEEINIINVYDLEIDSCDDCGFCGHEIGCSKIDDMETIHDLLVKADTLILSSPIYFAALSDKLMKVINRFQRYFSQKFMIKDSNIPTVKNVILVSTQASDKTRFFNGPIETLYILDKLFNPLYHTALLIPESDDIAFITPKFITQIETIKKR